MRRRTVRNGLRLVLAALLLIIIASYYHLPVAELFLLQPSDEIRIYRLGIFWAAAIGCYGVVMTAFGFALSPHKNDIQVRFTPVIIGISALIFIFFYLLFAAIDAPPGEEQRRLRPGETITI